MKNKPVYITEIETHMKNVKSIALKDLFLKFRRHHPEIKSMRTLKEDIETYLDGLTVTPKDIVINKALLIDGMLGIVSNEAV